MKIGCLILASGHSKRFGENKLLKKLKDKAVIEWTFKCVSCADFDRILVVTQYYEVFELSKKYKFESLLSYNELQSDTLKLGMNNFLDMDACMICLADQPLCKAKTIANMLKVYKKNSSNIIRLSYEDKEGNPVIFPKKYFKELLDISGDKGGRDVIAQNRNNVILVGASSKYELYDIDFKEDFNKIQQYIENL